MQRAPRLPHFPSNRARVPAPVTPVELFGQLRVRRACFLELLRIPNAFLDVDVDGAWRRHCRLDVYPAVPCPFSLPSHANDCNG
jgi:hypothetical protein